MKNNLRYQKLARTFAEEEMKPYAAELDRRQGTTFDWEIVRRFARANLLGLGVPQEYGGLGVDHLTSAVVCENWARLSRDFRGGRGTWLAPVALPRGE